MTRVFWIAGSTAMAVGLGVLALTGGAQARGGEQRAQMLEEFDTDGDGSISTEERQAAAAARFAEADANGDGSLDREEMIAAAEARREARETARREARVDRMIERRDTDGDGMLSQEEMTAPRREALFARIDGDGDGSISPEEFEALPDRMRGRGDRPRGDGR